jgi:hypothetical protein
MALGLGVLSNSAARIPRVEERVRAGRIDYRMARRAVLRDVETGLRSPGDVCDAHPDLVRAGRNLGEEIDDGCPICETGALRLVTYVFGRRIGRHSGRVVPRHDLGSVTQRYGPVTVYTVEVCTDCSWNHLRESYAIGRGRR